MATKAEELASGCLSRVADDEPLFVLRAQDRCAPKIVRAWASFAFSQGAPVAKVEEARDLADRMEAWQNKNRVKTPD